MSQDLLQDWQTLYASAISQAESGQLGTGIEEAEVAIQRRLEANALSALEEAELCAALRNLKRLKKQLLGST